MVGNGLWQMQLVKFFLGILFFAAGAVFVAWHDGPGLLRDFQMRSDGVVAVEDARSVSVWCKPSQIVFSSCDVSFEIAGGSDGEKATKYERDFTALAGLLGKQQVTVVRSSVDPSEVSTGLNLDYLWSRLLVFIFLQVTFLGFVVFSIYQRLGSWRQDRKSAARPAHVAVAPRRAVQPVRRFGTR